jgi:hypothetical protein
METSERGDYAARTRSLPPLPPDARPDSPDLIVLTSPASSPVRDSFFRPPSETSRFRPPLAGPPVDVDRDELSVLVDRRTSPHSAELASPFAAFQVQLDRASARTLSAVQAFPTSPSIGDGELI